eukprot:TRINITY_DN1119_c2_g1_i1.p1 TRINITY_DN1119_c2_g1~~TRINITY_DN1119_c2_g1_i1.p1  ORF type:complete len:771 (+),score=173.81 TRINITY_DN1119_c2_g1_i1:44-2314(+)
MALRSGLLLTLTGIASALKGSWQKNYEGYQVVDKSGRVIFESTDGVAVYVEGGWATTKGGTLIKKTASPKSGTDTVYGQWSGEVVTWEHKNTIVLATSIKNYVDESKVEFEVAYPTGLQGPFGGETTPSVANFPAFDEVLFKGARSWHGSFMNYAESQTTGPQGGPTIFFETDEQTKKVNKTVIGSVINNFKSSTAGSGKTWSGKNAWAPGTTSTLKAVPAGYQHNFILIEGEGITETVSEWGKGMRERYSTKKVDDVTLAKIGYQTDNGAYYVFCSGNCSKTLIDVKESFDQMGIPLGYLSFQGAGASKDVSNGNAAPWCIGKWGPDGGTGGNYPVPLPQFHEDLGIPMQYYAPYFCPENSYFPNKTQWTGTRSDTNISGCGSYDFWDVTHTQSRDFYNWFFQKGIDAGMASFEPDFMNQNYNCVPEFIESVDASPIWMAGMNGAALDKKIAVQWCYATPTDIMQALQFDAVTNFRVSMDFCYGRSWDIGGSSILAWAMGASPSKDTLWSSDNNKFPVPGCNFEPDHNTVAAPLHVALALMSTGPLGISDGLNMTNATLLKTTVTKDGTLLKPSKPVTSIDSLIAKAQYGPKGNVYATYSGSSETDVWAYSYISFLMTAEFNLPESDVFPAPVAGAKMYYREFNDPCKESVNGCLKEGLPVFPKSDMTNTTAGTNYGPSLVTLYAVKPGQKTFLLGEVDKLVPLSPVRFSDVTADSCTVTGTPGEVVTVYAAEVSGSLLKKQVTIPASGKQSVTF